MSDTHAPPGGNVTVLGWVIPRPTGRWHQSFVVTSRHLWVTPELTFANNERLEAAAHRGAEAFVDHIRHAGWKTRPDRCELAQITTIESSKTTGWIRITTTDDKVIGVMIPDRDTGASLAPLLKQAIGGRIPNRDPRRY